MTIYTYIPFNSTMDIMANDIKSFKTYQEAESYANEVKWPHYSIIDNELIIK